MKVKSESEVPQSCPTLSDPMDCSLTGSSVHGIYIYIYILLLLSRFSHVRLCATPWTAAYQASRSMGFSRQEHWSGSPFPSPRDYSSYLQIVVFRNHHCHYCHSFIEYLPCVRTCFKSFACIISFKPQTTPKTGRILAST